MTGMVRYGKASGRSPTCMGVGVQDEAVEVVDGVFGAAWASLVVDDSRLGERLGAWLAREGSAQGAAPLCGRESDSRS